MLKAPARVGPGASIRPAVITSSCHTPVVKRTPASSIEPKPLKKTSEPTTASENDRTRSIAGSSSGLG